MYKKSLGLHFTHLIKIQIYCALSTYGFQKTVTGQIIINFPWYTERHCFALKLPALAIDTFSRTIFSSNEKPSPIFIIKNV